MQDFLLSFLSYLAFYVEYQMTKPLYFFLKCSCGVNSKHNLKGRFFLQVKYSADLEVMVSHGKLENNPKIEFSLMSTWGSLQKPNLLDSLPEYFFISDPPGY